MVIHLISCKKNPIPLKTNSLMEQKICLDTFIGSFYHFVRYLHLRGTCNLFLGLFYTSCTHAMIIECKGLIYEDLDEKM